MSLLSGVFAFLLPLHESSIVRDLASAASPHQTPNISSGSPMIFPLASSLAQRPLIIRLA